MKKQIWMVFLLACLSAQASTYHFTQKADFPPSPRHRATGFSIGNKGYMGCGHINAGGSTIVYNDFWEYDPASNSWTQRADFGGGARYAAVGFSIGDKGYMGTGLGTGSGTAAAGQDFWEYNPATNIWTEKAPVPGFSREGAVGFCIQGKGYVGWGAFSSGDLYQYDPATNIWTTMATEPLSGGPSYTASFVINDSYAIVTTGFGSTSDYFKYDAATNTWTDEGLCPIPSRFGATGFSIDGKGFVGLGADFGYNDMKDFWVYNPDSTLKWYQINDFPGSKRHYVPGFTIDGKGYFGTGSNGTNLPDFWELSIARPSIPDTMVIDTIIDTITDTTTAIYNFPTQPYRFYPNPVINQLIIDWASELPAESRVLIFDVDGKQIIDKTVSGLRSTINCSQLPAGEYLVRIVLGNRKCFTQKIIKY